MVVMTERLKVGWVEGSGAILENFDEVVNVTRGGRPTLLHAESTERELTKVRQSELPPGGTIVKRLRFTVPLIGVVVSVP